MSGNIVKLDQVRRRSTRAARRVVHGYDQSAQLELFPAHSLLSETPKSEAASVTYLSQSDQDTDNTLSQLLVEHSHEDRWVMCVAPDAAFQRFVHDSPVIDKRKVLMIYVEPPEQQFDTLIKALSVGTCSLVISWPSSVETSWHERLVNAAQTGRSRAVVISQSQRDASNDLRSLN